jgi:hypothetical protein
LLASLTLIRRLLRSSVIICLYLAGTNAPGGMWPST